MVYSFLLILYINISEENEVFFNHYYPIYIYYHIK